MRLRTVALFVTLAFGILSGPLAAEAQPPGKVPRIGFLCPISKPGGPYLLALRKGLRELGYVEGQSITIEARFAEERLERFSGLVAELVQLRVDVLVPMGPSALRAARQATSTIPIVMAGAADPIGTGFVASLARPGGNITGLTSLASELAGKRLELLKEVLPGLRRVAIFWHPTEPEEAAEWREADRAARALGLQLQSLEVRASDDLTKAFLSLTKERVDALVNVGWFAPASTRAESIIAFAVANRLPTMFSRTKFVEDGGFMSFSANYEELYRRTATYVDKLLKGARPGDLPVEQPTRFELVINMKTAKALGLTIPQSVLIRADRVIQ
ncbi:MAG: ABC transporter substrate-binding protein [Candidatus Rokubacteria bacterium]|nr:ABC transporter substrate-binding protein [Candidatus Rokubacteria bacterium]